MTLRTPLLTATMALAAVLSPLSHAAETTPTTILVSASDSSHSVRSHWRHLDLSSAQQDQLFELRHQHEPEMRRLHTAVRDAQNELRALANAPRFDEDKATASSEKLGKAEAELSLLRTRLHAQRLAILTPEQREQLQQSQAAQRDYHHGRQRPAKRHTEKHAPFSDKGPQYSKCL